MLIQEFEFWWLISYPVVFAMGWFAARIDLKHLLSESRSVPTNYFVGLKFLLSNQTDKAIEAFNQIVKSDSDDNVELTFALGGLFRRRGEYDRAIRLHQDLIRRTDLSEADHANGHFELGMDFYKAGMLDRAEAAFTPLLATAKREKVLRVLLEIYQAEKAWVKAIDLSAQIPPDSVERQSLETAQFHCELAQTALNHNQLTEARGRAEKALSINRRAVRATILLGDVATRDQDHRLAIAHWNQIETQNPDYLAMVASRLITAYRCLGRLDEAYDRLVGYLTQYPSIDLLDAVSELAKELKGPDEAFRLVHETLKRTPTLLGLEKLIEAELSRPGPQRRRDDLEMARQLVYSRTRALARHHCRHCGFAAKQFYWRCPGCGNWETYSPRRSEEVES